VHSAHLRRLDEESVAMRRWGSAAEVDEARPGQAAAAAAGRPVRLHVPAGDPTARWSS